MASQKKVDMRFSHRRASTAAIADAAALAYHAAVRPIAFLQKRVFFMSFPYVCPEPVLVK
jgi:hypothetical protein